MSAATDLITRGQKFHASHFPATVTIDGATYTDASKTGIRQEKDLMSGGFTGKVEITYWIPIASFATAGKSVPYGQRLQLTDGSATYIIARTVKAGDTIALHCETTNQ